MTPCEHGCIEARPLAGPVRSGLVEQKSWKGMVSNGNLKVNLFGGSFSDILGGDTLFSSRRFHIIRVVHCIPKLVAGTYPLFQLYRRIDRGARSKHIRNLLGSPIANDRVFPLGQPLFGFDAVRYPLGADDMDDTPRLCGEDLLGLGAIQMLRRQDMCGAR